MTVPTSTAKSGPYAGAGTVGPFTVGFRFLENSHLQVILTSSTGVDTTLALTTDYTASGAGGVSGSVTLVTALAVGQQLTVIRNVPFTQDADYVQNDAFPAESHERSLDKLTMQTQQLLEAVDRAAKLPVTSLADSEELVADITLLADNIVGLTAVYTAIPAITTVANDLNEPVSEINTVATSIANVDAVGTNITNVNTVAGISANVTSVAGNATNINAVAGNASNITAVAGNATNINSVVGNATNINTVATNIASVNSAATNMAAIIAAPTQAAAAAASAAASAASAALGMYSAVQDKSADYTVVSSDAGDLIRITTTGGGRTITLPAISTQVDGFKVAIVKWTGDSNAVTVVRSASDTINGATSYNLGSQYNSATFVADFETSQWFAVASGIGTTNAVVDRFNGTGAQTAFTLSGDPGSLNNTYVFVGGVYQQKNTYSVSGSTLTFSAAPPAGTGNIEAVWTQPLAIGTPSDGTVSTAKVADAAVTTVKLADAAVTYAKMQNITAGKLLGRDTSGSGVLQELPVAVGSNGNVSIGGTDTSFSKLSVRNGTIYVNEDGANTKQIYIRSDFSGAAAIQVATNDPFVIATNNIERFRIDATGQMSSRTRNAGTVMEAYDCRAMVTFNGSGAVAIRSSANVSSITDLGVGLYSVNFVNAMPDANYSPCGFATSTSGLTNNPYVSGRISTSPSAGGIQINVGNGVNGQQVDCEFVSVSIFC